MKKILVVFMCLFCVSMQAQEYVQEGTTFKEVKRQKASRKPDPGKETEFTYQFSNGEMYPIWISPKGKAYVNKVSKKTGKEYKFYLDSTIVSKMSNLK